METNYPVHKIDDLGRVLIPKEIRATLGWNVGNSLSLKVEDGTLVLVCIEQEQSSQIRSLPSLFNDIQGMNAGCEQLKNIPSTKTMAGCLRCTEKASKKSSHFYKPQQGEP